MKEPILRPRTEEEEAADWEDDPDEAERDPSGLNFKMRRMCANCPFKKKGAIELMPGRLEGIIQHLRSDYNYFPCHKTTHGAAKEESVCMGSLAYGLKNTGRLPIVARIGLRFGDLKMADIEANYPDLKEPEDIT
jgi:hypothetical protein